MPTAPDHRRRILVADDEPHIGRIIQLRLEAGPYDVEVVHDGRAALERIRGDVPVLMKGGYSKRDQDADSPTFIVESVTPFAELRLNGQVSIAIELQLGESLAPETMQDVRAVVDAHGGRVRWHR